MTRTVQEFILIDTDEQYCPPERVLVVGMVDDLLCLTISKYEETAKTRKTQEIANICVDARAFYDFFTAIWKDEHRAPVMLGKTPVEPMHGKREGDPHPKRGRPKKQEPKSDA